MRNAVLVTIVVLLISTFFTLAQSAPEPRTFSIVGHPGTAKVLDLNGKSYVEIEDLTRLSQGSLAFKANQVLLTLPGGQAVAPATPPPVKRGFSREFLQAGIEAMSAIREWRITVVNWIHNNSPFFDESLGELRRRADTSLALAAAARSTEDDRNGYPLLAAESANMHQLSDRYQSMRKSLEYIDPSSIDNDPLDQQITACAKSLSSMAADNQFRDDGTCTEAQ